MDKLKRYIGWFSCGVTSAVACKLAIDEYGAENVALFYIGIDSAHSDNARFIQECEDWMGVKVQRVDNGKYKDQFDVIAKTGYVNGAAGSRCTLELKKKVRQRIEKDLPDASQVFGFEFEKNEINRAIRFSEQYPHTNPRFPLIDNELTKPACAGILLKNGIKLPQMYELGFHNNNCIGCVKGGKGYWNHIRKHFPEQFDKMAKLERKVGRSCLKTRKVVNGESKTVLKFLDELDPTEGRHEEPILPDCGTFCEVEFADIIHPSTEAVYMDGRLMRQLKLF